MLGDNRFRRELNVFMWMVERLVPCLFSQTLRLLLQKDWRVQLWEKEESKDGRGKRPDRLDVLSPSPAKMRIDEERGTNRGTQGRPTNDS